MAIKDEQGNWLDARGSAIPAKYIDKKDKLRDECVTKAVSEMLKLEEQMTKVKSKVLGMIGKYLDSIGRSQDEQWKGNLTLRDFSNSLALEIAINDSIQFDEKLQIAKNIIDDLVAKWGENSAKELVAVFQQAFNVDKSGRINQAMILRLLKLKIEGPEWEQAMNLIRESIQVIGSKRYLVAKRRIQSDIPGSSKATGKKTAATRDGEWETVNLNFSSMEAAP